MSNSPQKMKEKFKKEEIITMQIRTKFSRLYDPFPSPKNLKPTPNQNYNQIIAPVLKNFSKVQHSIFKNKKSTLVFKNGPNH